MSTRCLIARQNKNSVTTGIYCHHDGYPDGVGSILNRHYTSAKSIDRLIRRGDISALGPTPTRGTEAFGYDAKLGPDSDYAPFTCDDDDIIAASCHSDVEWVYLWRDKSWWVAENVFQCGLAPFEPLAPKIDPQRELEAKKSSAEHENELRVHLMIALAYINREMLPLSISSLASLNEMLEKNLTKIGYLKDGKMTEQGLDAAWAIMEHYHMTTGIEAEGTLPTN